MRNVDSKMSTLASKITEYVTAVENLSQTVYKGPFQDIYRKFNNQL